MSLLEPATVFDGLRKRKLSKGSSLVNPVECAKCKGHGEWVLGLNAYGDGLHFKGSCGACWGHGWVEEGQCLHEWDKERSIGNCMHEWSCSLCGTKRAVDSSG